MKSFKFLLLVMVSTLFSTLLLGCSSLLFYPTRTLYVDTKKMSPTPVEHRIESEDGEKIVIWHLAPAEPKNSKGLIVFFHGNGQNLSAHFYYLYWILQKNYEYVIFDYPGYGGSTGEPTPKNAVTSGKAAIRWAHKQRPGLPLFIYGQSLGGAIALKTASEIRGELDIKGIVADSTFQSYKRAGQKVMANSWITWLFQPLSYILLSDTHAPKSHLHELKGIPFLVLHGDKDTLINISLGEELYEDLPDPKDFYVVQGGQHGDGLVGMHAQNVQARFLSFLEFARNSSPLRK